MRVRSMMQRSVACLGPEDSLRDAYEVMEDGGFRHIPILDEDRLVGIVSDRDVLLRAVLDEEGVIVPDIPLEDVMTTDLITCLASARLGEVSNVMIENKIDSLPVVDLDGCLVGIVTSTDLLSVLGADEEGGYADSPLPFTYQLERRGRAGSAEATRSALDGNR